ncbi:Xaa-Pro aminopeptidase [Alkalilimnicola sp. S0819]|uniref:Xaa-Pro aminopeptidase n=1 Tax=Alkalilimnicola sp. S0819 TaxID=2613922 RepID=UPI001261F9A7|nr:Xaa-Pro aminopeptidase [Alkalilimnicola sp. S0819]KAB7628209.1 Xaa-Pro aminopeptidase [Alkalilimnicola sp. S0819]MPQ15100.1 Xaa-Pro aminopeptidase [Alkalilimnicola sp. S0819]
MIEQSEFARRRRELMSVIGEGGIAVVPAAPERPRNRDAFYPYRQDSDFHYLSGFDEPEAVLVLIPGRAHGEYILFNRERDPDREIWDGPRAGQQGACRDYGADDAFPIDDIDEILPGLLEGTDRVFHTMGVDPEFDHRVIGWVSQVRQKARAGVRAPGEFVSLEHWLHEMRLIKSAAEINVMRRAAQVSAEAHRQAMRICRPGLYEYEIEAEFQAAFRRHNGWPAYTPIVGGGRNACILHYIENKARLRDGDLLLIDAGAELDCYAADITRTFPVNGRFSAEQRAVYEVVLAAQQAAIDATGPGRSWNAGHEAATRVLCEGIAELGLLQGSAEDIEARGDYKRFFMHRTGHWLGMDVHDVGDYKIDGQWRELEPGMVLTVEPGLYIAGDQPDVDERWWNIGVRIEDDVLITRDGCEVLTADAPKRVADIEALMAQG